MSLTACTRANFRISAVVTDGPFRSNRTLFVAGVLLGRADVASRGRAIPDVVAGPEFAEWATEQGRLIETFVNESSDLSVKSLVAQFVRRAGGSTGDLPIVRTCDGLLSFNQIAARQDLPCAVELIPDHWGVAGFEPCELSPNQFGVASGRMQPLWYDHNQFVADFKMRGKHRHWVRYWRSLWGATIEAIASAWNVPIDAVLELSENVEDDNSNTVSTIAVIRKPDV